MTCRRRRRACSFNAMVAGASCPSPPRSTPGRAPTAQRNLRPRPHRDNPLRASRTRFRPSLPPLCYRPRHGATRDRHANVDQKGADAADEAREGGDRSRPPKYNPEMPTADADHGPTRRGGSPLPERRAGCQGPGHPRSLAGPGPTLPGYLGLALRLHPPPVPRPRPLPRLDLAGSSPSHRKRTAGASGSAAHLAMTRDRRGGGRSGLLPLAVSGPGGRGRACGILKRGTSCRSEACSSPSSWARRWSLRHSR